MASLLAPHENHVQSGATRVIDTPFQVDADKDSLCVYTIEFSVQFQDGEVTLFRDANPTPVASIGTARQKVTLLLGLVTISTVVRQQITVWVPAGHYVLLSETGVSGAASLVDQLEVTFDDQP